MTASLQKCLTASSFGFFVLAIVVFAQQDKSEGELTVYGMMTQVGTVARREFRDEKGRVSKRIFYTVRLENVSSFGPFREKDFHEHSISLLAYDENNCMIREQNIIPPARTSSVREIECKPGTAIPRLTTYRDHRGIRDRETRHNETGGSKTVLYFDSEGKKVVAIKGALPDDVDLVNGWGKAQDGLVVGVAANQAKGRQRDLRIYSTIKREAGVSPETFRRISPLAYELTDSRGRTVHFRGPLNKTEPVPDIENCPGKDAFDISSRSGAELLWGVVLQDHYDRIPPGNYKFRLKICQTGSAKPIFSNTISLELID